jgi:hypothetical protein
VISGHGTARGTRGLVLKLHLVMLTPRVVQNALQNVRIHILICIFTQLSMQPYSLPPEPRHIHTDH